MQKNIMPPKKINPVSLSTETLLAEFIDALGFKSQPISRETSEAIIMGRDRGVELPPQRLLSWEDNEGFENSFAVVSIEEGALYVYYYEENDDLFKVWEKFGGEVETEAIRKSIRSAVTKKDLALRLYYFWPERIYSGEDVRLILSSIAFKSKDIKWPDGLPCAGESVDAPHQLIAANEHNLDTDAIVSVENLTANIYYRDPASNVYRLWAKLKTEKTKPDDLPEIQYSTIYSAIMSAMTAKKETEKFMGCFLKPAP
jgi:hypothetical protein